MSANNLAIYGGMNRTPCVTRAESRFIFTNVGAMRKIRSTLKTNHSGDSDRGKGASVQCDE